MFSEKQLMFIYILSIYQCNYVVMVITEDDNAIKLKLIQSVLYYEL